MLEQLVKEIRASGTLEVSSLAIRLNTTAKVVEAMLDHLQRSGLISAYVNGGEGCQGCSLSDTCGQKPQPTMRLWQSS